MVGSVVVCSFFFCSERNQNQNQNQPTHQPSSVDCIKGLISVALLWLRKWSNRRRDLAASRSSTALCIRRSCSARSSSSNCRLIRLTCLFTTTKQEEDACISTNDEQGSRRHIYVLRFLGHTAIRPNLFEMCLSAVLNHELRSLFVVIHDGARSPEPFLT